MLPSMLWKAIWWYASDALKSTCPLDPIFDFQKLNPQTSGIHCVVHAVEHIAAVKNQVAG